MLLPTARTADLLEQEVDKELLVYDLRINKAYNLNETSKSVLRACDGQTSFDELKRRHNYTDDLIHFALDELQANNLLENRVANHFAGLSRREVIRQVGLATMVALPLIASITAPKASRAASNQLADELCEEVECPYAQTQCMNDGTCDSATGDCVENPKPAGTPCDDGDFSTTGDVCDGSGACAGVCVGGLTDCGTAPRCKDLQTDLNNCGACDNVCLGGQICISGACTNSLP